MFFFEIMTNHGISGIPTRQQVPAKWAADAAERGWRCSSALLTCFFFFQVQWLGHFSKTKHVDFMRFSGDSTNNT